jgi:hypothetical protein
VISPLFFFHFQIIEIMIFILSKVPPRLSYDQLDPHGVDVESELQHTLLKAFATRPFPSTLPYEME